MSVPGAICLPRSRWYAHCVHDVANLLLARATGGTARWGSGGLGASRAARRGLMAKGSWLRIGRARHPARGATIESFARGCRRTAARGSIALESASSRTNRSSVFTESSSASRGVERVAPEITRAHGRRTGRSLGGAGQRCATTRRRRVALAGAVVRAGLSSAASSTSSASIPLRYHRSWLWMSGPSLARGYAAAARASVPYVEHARSGCAPSTASRSRGRSRSPATEWQLAPGPTRAAGRGGSRGRLSNLDSGIIPRIWTRCAFRCSGPSLSN